VNLNALAIWRNREHHSCLVRTHFVWKILLLLPQALEELAAFRSCIVDVTSLVPLTMLAPLAWRLIELLDTHDLTTVCALATSLHFVSLSRSF
jgi:hypothetical protein